ncbi:nitrous oxide reductase accessory protein NosL [Roseovarius phycicola]|uniref:Nitrous oxide reductase accessory protein NosL n=1 Tax=Roseovarius phycicola TaxID=3080976 RepID=A0ABZ2HBY6_9RHOB
MKRTVLTLAALACLGACKEEIAEIPLPVNMTVEAVSYYCQMSVLEHGGPKAQIHLEGMPAPLFFAQVRDAMAFLKSPERDHRVVVTYVSDMGSALDWSTPGIDNWTVADTAVFVIEGGIRGGMGAPEVVPFADQTKAEAFVTRYGGRIVSLEEIPDDVVIGPVDPDIPLTEPTS